MYQTILYKLAYLNNISCRAVYLGLSINSEIRKLPKSVDKVTVADIFRKTLSKHPRKTAFIFEQKTWRFQDVEDYSNRIANYFKSQGYKKGEVVGLFLESCPEYICIWFGLSKLGVITALINTNLRLDSLWHCMSTADVKAIIFGTDLSGNLNFSYTTRRGSRILKWGVNFCNNVREIKYYFNIRGIRKRKKKEGGSGKREGG